MDADAVRVVYETYARALVDGDVDAIVRLFADNATLNDPVDGPAVVGATAIREFFDSRRGVVTAMELAGPVCVAADGSTAAAPYRVVVSRDPAPTRLLDSIDVFEFDAAGRISAMRGYWGPSNSRPA